MNSDHKLEMHLEKNALAIKELAIRIEALNRDVAELLKELKVRPDQLTSFIENKDNFSEENWNTLIDQKKSLDEKLMRELLNISNPKKTKKSLKERHVPQHWLFVR